MASPNVPVHHADRRNLADSLSDWAERRPSAPSIVEGDRTVSYRQLDLAVWRAAKEFRERGVGQGDFVGIALPNSALFLVAFYGLARLGAVCVALPLHESAKYRADLVARFAVRAVVTAGGDYGVPAIAPDPAWLDAADTSPDESLRADGGDRPLKVAFSWGVAGRPRAVLRSHRASMAIEAHRRMVVTQSTDDVFVATLDMALSYGLRPCLRNLEAGACIVIPPPGVTASAFAALVIDSRATHLALTPNFVAALLAESALRRPMFPHLRELVVSTAASSERMRREIRQGIAPNLLVAYGANEVNVVAMAPPGLQDRYPGCVGCVLPGIDAVAVDDDGKPVAEGALGRLGFRAPWFPAGYFDDMEATARHFRDGWFFPGDVGTLGAGRVLHLKGRTDDVINFNGLKIMPVDIEDVLLQHPAVEAAAAFSVPSDVHQQIPVAAVKLRRPAKAEDLLAFARDRLQHRSPWYVLVFENLPKTPFGAPNKADLAAWVRAELTRQGRLADRL